jgi:hypothetical protein
VIDSALIAKMRYLLAFGREVEVLGMRQHVTQHHQTGLDGLGLALAAIAAVLVSDGTVQRPELQVKDLPIVGEDVSAAMAAIQQTGAEIFAPLAPLEADPSVELTAYEVAAVQRDQSLKLGLSMGVTEMPLDIGNRLVATHWRDAHSARTCAVNSRPSHLARLIEVLL